MHIIIERVIVMQIVVQQAVVLLVVMLHTVADQVVVMQIVVRQAVVRQVNQGNQFHMEYTLPSGIVNHMASGCGINSEKVFNLVQAAGSAETLREKKKRAVTAESKDP
jgi:hypothetical protein